jgi:excisionase family DNA binding protein
MNDQIEQLYSRFLSLTGEPLAASNLALAAVIAGERADEKPLTVRQAAERLAVSVDSIYAACESGDLRHKRIGNGRGTIRISAADLRRYQA